MNKPRYFPATQWYGQIEFSGQPSTNNEEAVKWFYEASRTTRRCSGSDSTADGTS